MSMIVSNMDTIQSPLAILLGSKVRSEVLSFLITHPGESYYVRELARLLGRMPTPILRELAKLEQLGLATSAMRGNAKFYSIDPTSPLFPELQSLVMKTTAVGDVIRTAVTSLSAIRFAFVYGSFASGDVLPQSDIDLCVIGNIDTAALLPAIKTIEKRLGREVQYTIYREKEFLRKLRKKNDYLHQVIAGPRIMIIGGEDEFERFTQKGMD